MTYEIKKLQLERKKVDCGKDEMELKILKHLEDIERLKEQIKFQEKRITEIDKELLGMEASNE